MNRLAVSRRSVLALVGASALSVPIVASAREPTFQPRTNRVGASGKGENALQLVAPLVIGARLGAWQVQGVSEVRHGAMTVGLVDGSGATFFLDICAHDDRSGAPAPPARSERFDIFLANQGKGADPTHEDHGLAAMALAEIVRANENGVDPRGMLTLVQRLERYPNEIVRGV